MRLTRNFFEKQGYLEVETPALQHSPGGEVHIVGFKTEMLSADQQSRRDMYLHTSPEFAMKKLLAAGLPRIFQICRCYRNAEGSPIHSPEFTMLEWYHAGIEYKQLMQECVGLFRAVSAGKMQWENKTSDPHAEWEIITVCEAFRKYAGIDIENTLNDFDALAAIAPSFAHKGDSWEDLFFRIFLEKIEPQLGHPTPTIIYDYPASMAALARKKASDPRFAERFEIYVCGMELANAFGELTDAKEQRARLEQDMALKEKLYGQTWPVDEDFIAALEHGLPQSSGIALGFDRLAMLVSGASRIEQVLWLPVAR